MDELDTHTCILEPEHPSKAHIHRRILLATHLSVVLHVNPHRPCSLPEPLQFLGPDNSESYASYEKVQPVRRVLLCRGERTQKDGLEELSKME